MKIRKPFLAVICMLAAVVLVAGIAALVYLNSLFSLIDRTEITGNPNLAESDLLDDEERIPAIEPAVIRASGAPAGNPPAGGPSATQIGAGADTPGTPASGSDPSGAEPPGDEESMQPPAGTEASSAWTVPSGTEAPQPGTMETEPSPAASPTPPAETAVPSTTASPPIQPGSEDVFSILLVGADTRGTGFDGRSDSMIILSVNRRTRKIHMVSLARNMIVHIQGHGESMLNYAYAWGGMPLLLQTINENFRLTLENYLVINFSGFKKAIDYCGGTYLPLTAAEVEYMYLAFPDGTFKVGTNHLNGEQTLVYARIRWIDSDYSRTARQRRVILNLIARLKTRTPAQIDALMRKVLPLMRTNLSNKALIELSIAALQFKSYPISQLMLPLDTSSRTIEGATAEKNITALHHFLYED